MVIVARRIYPLCSEKPPPYQPFKTRGPLPGRYVIETVDGEWMLVEDGVVYRLRTVRAKILGLNTWGIYLKHGDRTIASVARGLLYPGEDYCGGARGAGAEGGDNEVGSALPEGEEDLEVSSEES